MVEKDGHSYFATLEIRNVTVEDAGKYKVTAKNELGESNATISLNFDSKYKSHVTLKSALPLDRSIYNLFSILSFAYINTMLVSRDSMNYSHHTFLSFDM